MLHKSRSTCCAALAAMACFMGAQEASATTLTIDNWRHIYMNSAYVSGGSNEALDLYAIHTTRQENLVFSFDLSAYAGQTATSGATMTFLTAAGSSGTGYSNTTYTIELRQLNNYNANVNLDAAGSYWRDAPAAGGGTLAWYNNSGSALANLNYASSVLDITSGLIASVSGPIGGDTTSTDIATGTAITFNISQAVLQSWLDGTKPAEFVMDIDRPAIGVDIGLQSGATLTFQSGAAAPEPGTLALAGLAAGFLGFTRRRGARIV